jgi:hypothetical protein
MAMGIGASERVSKTDNGTSIRWMRSVLTEGNQATSMLAVVVLHPVILEQNSRISQMLSAMDLARKGDLVLCGR